MKKLGIVAAAAALFGGAMFGLAPAPATATALTGFAVAAPGETAVTEEVRHRRGHRSRRHRHSRRYDRHRHGSRYRYRRPGFTFHYGGYYYANPWWQAPGVGFGVTVPVYPAPSLHLPSRHVQWCMRYRTYDPRTDTYVPRIGVRARCNSPYN
ncbi:MAG: BA14K family protein [Hyphomicrobiales bacterium]